MFNATYFTYDGVWSGQYGLKIASFDDEGKTDTTVFTPSITNVKLPRSTRFFKTSVRYDSPSQFQLTIVSERIIEENARRNILSWLVGRKGYKKLIVHQPDLESYYYNCIFTDASEIYINGYCFGFNITANLDCPYQYGTPNIKTFESDNTNEMNVVFYNPSDIVDDYVYPIVRFTPKGTFNGSDKSVISIINTTDNSSRAFMFNGISATSNSTEQITVDNEIKSITSSSGIKRLQNFNKNWLRLRKGDNYLTIKIKGSVTIECPFYSMIGF